jgi:hypothetical protein
MRIERALGTQRGDKVEKLVNMAIKWSSFHVWLSIYENLVVK